MGGISHLDFNITKLTHKEGVVIVVGSGAFPPDPSRFLYLKYNFLFDFCLLDCYFVKKTIVLTKLLELEEHVNIQQYLLIIYNNFS